MRNVKKLFLLFLIFLQGMSPAFATNSLSPGYISNSGRTQSDVQAALEQWVLFCDEDLGAAAETTQTTSGNAITPPVGSGNVISVNTSGGAGNLDTIVPTNCPNGRLLLIRSANPSGNPVTVRNMQGGTGQIQLFGGTNFLFTTTHQWLLLKLTSTTWEQVLPCYGDSSAAWEAFLGLGTAANANTGTSSSNVPTISQADARYAAIAGSTSQAFNVSNTGSSNNALSYTTAASTYAPIAGNSSQTFNVADPTSAHHAVSKQYADSNYGGRPRFVSGAQTLGTGSQLTIAHSLGAIPVKVWFVLKCTGANVSFAINDQVIVHPSTGSTASSGNSCPVSVNVDATNVYINFANSGDRISLTPKGGGSAQSITYADWQLFVYAEL